LEDAVGDTSGTTTVRETERRCESDGPLNAGLVAELATAIDTRSVTSSVASRDTRGEVGVVDAGHDEADAPP
jgi:hypothetical protein